MLSNEFYAELDTLWTDFWPATDIKPLAVIDFINTIFFVRQLEEMQEKKERSAAFYGKPVESPIFTQDQQELRWSSFQNLDKQSLYLLFNRKDNGVLDFARQTQEYKKLSKFDTENKALVPTPDLLKNTIQLIGSLDVVDSTTRADINTFLLHKVEEAAKASESTLPELEIKKPLKKNRFQLSALNVSIILLLLFIAGFAIASFYFGTAKNNSKVTKIETKNGVTGGDTLVVPATEIAGKKNRKTVTTPVKKIESKEEQKTSIKTKPKAAPELKNKTIEVQSEDTADVKGEYKVISKAYFHNEPDESTRRNAFVVHWNNSYATLKALDEKNGFVYVIFRNHLNQTSKGWLRKKDLRPVESTAKFR